MTLYCCIEDKRYLAKIEKFDQNYTHPVFLNSKRKGISNG